MRLSSAALALVLLVSHHALPVEARPRELPLRGELVTGAPAPGGVTATAGQNDTTWFGGTVWAADSLRWEAIEGGVWTFDSGVGSHFDHSAPHVNPFKDPSLHAYMEGWVGWDRTYGLDGEFRRLTASDFAADDAVCVGSAAGLGGDASYWAGLRNGEADALCYAARRGYGNSWNVAVQKSFAYAGGNVVLQFDYVNDTEPGWDYTYVLAETSATADPVEIAVYEGAVSGHATFTLQPGIDLPVAPGPVRILFRVVSDGAYSDEDGLYATACGAFAVDDVALSGGIVDGPATFETGDDGWALRPADPGLGGDWSNLVHLDDLPPRLGNFPCPESCGIRDSVLVFVDTSIPGGGHNLYQDNVAVSPWIDLLAAGAVGKPGKVVQVDAQAYLPLLNYVFSQVEMQWYPEVCPTTGKLITSDFLTNGFCYYYGDCNFGLGGCKTFQRGGFPIPAGAEQVRIALGVASFCRFYGNCAGLSGPQLWYDNVRLGVFGVAGAPEIYTSSYDLPADAFPADGTLDIASPGRVDAAFIWGNTGPNTARGDTLVVQTYSRGVEVRVQFAVDPGPGSDGVRFGSWLAQHAAEGSWLSDRAGQPLPWYSARMDTAQRGATLRSYGYMTAYHEDDPNFTGLDTDVDPTDLDLTGQATRLANDIFPDDLFTPGTRLSLFFKARYDGSIEPFTGVWYVLPDTAGGNCFEMEVLPSSMAADSAFNCILYVDHADGYAGQSEIEPALRAVLPGASANFEGVPWDRWDVRAPTSDQGSFARPLGAEYGATLSQALGYRTIVWDTGTMPWMVLDDYDAGLLGSWLALGGGGSRNLYVAGDQAAQSMAYVSQNPVAASFLNDYLGATLVCETLRDANCPSGSVQDASGCMPLANTPGGHFMTFPAPAYAGNGCPQFRRFDVLAVSPSAASGDARGNLSYAAPIKGTVEFASVSNHNVVGSEYKTVLDGGSLSVLRNSGCGDASGAEARLSAVLDWFGAIGGDACRASGTPLGVAGDPPRPVRPALALLSANPVRSGGAVHLAAAAPAGSTLRVQVFDVAGRLVRTLLDESSDGTLREVVWDLRADGGRAVSGGIYFVRLAGASAEARRVVVLP